MGSHRTGFRSMGVAAVAVAGMVLGIRAAGPGNFKPDAVFTGSALTGWQVVGDAEWKAENGELIGKAKPGTNGGWLVMNKAFQDVQLFTNYRCEGTCSSGVLLRMQKTADGGTTGVYASLTDGEVGQYSVTLDAQGRELLRERLTAPVRGGGAAAAAPRAGGPAPAAGAPAPAAAAPVAAPTPAAPTAPAAAAPAAPAAARAGGAAPAGAGRGAAVMKPGEWNSVEVLLIPTTVRTTFGATSALDEKNLTAYGPIAIYVGGTGTVHYKDVSWKDLNRVATNKEQLNSKYTMQTVNSLYYGWGATTADINKDGALDIISGPFYYLGPSFTERRLYREGRVYNPSTEFAPDMVNLTADFTGDGWPDILSTLGNRHMDLYVNPKGENRRWEKFSVLTTISTEIVLLKDLDKDGKPEVIFGAGAAGGYAWAKPDPANPTAVWTPHRISSPGEPVNGHGIGVGDINGDGRNDIVVPTGWYEQPAAGLAADGPWTFHPYTFGNLAVFGMNGGEMGVYDVNGDKLADVVSGSAHNWGLNWFEQKRAADGSITFEQHVIAQDFSTAAQNTGGVVFSESHAARFVDMNGDGIPDFVTGKRMWSELESYTAQDPYGDPVLYIYRTVRDPKAPGGARFVPELVHNRSGVGSSFDVVDFNKDGKPDIVTATAFGTFVFMSKPTPRAAAPAAPAAATR